MTNEQANQMYNAASVDYASEYKAIKQKYDDLLAETEALRRDAERYRWLRSHARYHYDNSSLTWYLPRLFAYKGPSPVERLDEQIDSAITRTN
jgi:hypothetical protein